MRHRRIFALSTAALLAAALQIAGCDRDPRCSLRPQVGGQYGECAAIIGYYYAHGSCHHYSGCECDEVCRRNYLPFATEQECIDVCE